MNRIEKTLSLYKQTFNCSQSVFTGFRQADELDEEAALKLATVFGAGIACTGRQLCGAVTGALMAISMKHGRGDVQSVDSKARTYQLARQFMTDFEARNGSCVCEQLICVNIGTPEGMKKAQQDRLFETRCYQLVKSAAELLESYI